MKTLLYFHSHSKINTSEKLSGVDAIASKCGWLVQVVDEIPKQRRLRALLEFWNPIGAIVECGGAKAIVDPTSFGDLPTVFLDHDPTRLPKSAFCVTHDSTATGRAAARELMSGRAKTFAFVPYPERRFWSDERYMGFASALKLNGHHCVLFTGRMSHGDPTRYQRELRRFTKSLPKPCAIFAANDLVAKEVLMAAKFSDIKIPDELSVVGVDNAKDICEHADPTISSVWPDFRRGGELAALMLLAMLREGKKFRGARRRTFGPLGVVRRASTRLIATADTAVERALETIRREACSGLKAGAVLERFQCSRRMAEIRFRKATGHSVMDEIHSARLSRAKELLKSSEMPLKTISDFCGFANPNSLRKFFLKSTGMTMRAYRASHSPRT